MKKSFITLTAVLALFSFSANAGSIAVLDVEKIVKESTKKETRKNTIDKIKQLSENTTQEFSSLKVVEKYPNAKFVGKTVSKDLVFEIEDKRLKISTKGGYKLL